MIRWGAALLAALALSFASPPLGATSFDVEGFGPEGIAEVNARAARADDGTATFYNPGGLGLGRGTRVEVAPTLGGSALSAQHRVLSLADPFGISLAFSATVPFDGVLKDRIRFGFGSYLLPTSLLRVVAHAEEQPFFPYFDNRTQRLVVIPAFAVRVLRGLAVGAGVDVLGGVSGPATVETGASGAPESRIGIEATTRLGAVLGVRFDPSDRVHLGVTFRQKFSVPSSVDTHAVVGGIPLAVSVNAAENLFDPDTLVLATAFDFGRLTLELDATYAAWSSYRGPFVEVHAELPAVDVQSNLATDIARDVVSLRGGGALRIDVGVHRVVLHGGLGFEPTMLRHAQQGRENLLDGDKIFVGLGTTLEVTHVAGKTLRFGFGVNTTAVLSDAQDKRACMRLPCGVDTVSGSDPQHPARGIDNPGFPRLEGGGSFWSGALGIGVDL